MAKKNVKVQAPRRFYALASDVSDDFELSVCPTLSELDNCCGLSEGDEVAVFELVGTKKVKTANIELV